MRADFAGPIMAMVVWGLVSVPGWPQKVGGEQVVSQQVMTGPGPAATAATSLQLFHATGPLPSYDVATIKAQASGPGPIMLGSGGGGRNMTHFIGTARMYINGAYGAPLGSSRILGGPKWLDDNRYSIDGKIPDDVFESEQKLTPEERQKQNRMRQQGLLADRFKLKAHFETRELPVYELTVAKGGIKMSPAKDPGPGDPNQAALPPPPPPGQPMGPPDPSKLRQGMLVLMKNGGMEMTAKGMTLTQVFQGPFFGFDGRPVIDKTGLMGKYDFVMDWTPDRPAAGSPGAVPGGAPTPSPAAEDNGPSIYTAVQEQLGLKLVPGKAPVEVLVIDSIELPSEN